MTKDWKKKIDNEERAQKAGQEKKKTEVKRVQQEIGHKELEDFHRKFKCHICGMQSPGPITRSSNDGLGWQERSAVDTTWTNWNEPEGLTKCSKCSKWTCKDHIYKDICQKCAEKM